MYKQQVRIKGSVAGYEQEKITLFSQGTNSQIWPHHHSVPIKEAMCEITADLVALETE